MTFELDVRGTRRAVSVEPAAEGRFHITIGGERHVVRAERTGEFELAVALDDGSGVSREITVTPGSAAGELLVGWGARLVEVAVDGRRRRASADAGVHAEGELAIVAPMPGRVVRVLVAAGDTVAAKQGIVVVEAMKMENELRSPKAGRIKDVAVTPGTLVEAGRALVVIE
jgi:acetyl/propionyl-CoA carboxylase alpha subunit